MTASPIRLLRGLALVLPLLLTAMTAVTGSAQEQPASFDPVTMDPMHRDSICPPGMEEL